MDRLGFIKTLPILALAPYAMKLKELGKLVDSLPATDQMPALFVGHGSPMNAIEDNSFSQGWATMAGQLPAPRAILCISAHWLTRGTFVTAMAKPRTIHDFGGFPQALFDVQYPAPGSVEVAAEVTQSVTRTNVGPDHQWGLDHGTWSVLRKMYPKADIPVLQLSIDYHQSPQYHYDLGRELVKLRSKGILIVGSGNIVHNLRMAKFGDNVKPYDWAVEFDDKIKGFIRDGNHAGVINFSDLGQAATLSVPTPDHYQPLLYALAQQQQNESIALFNEEMAFGSGSMTSVRIG